MTEPAPYVPPRDRPKGRRYDTASYAAFGQRIVVNGMGRRAADDVEMFAALVRLHDDVTRALVDAAENLRDNRALSWADIGDALGMSRQGARQRFNR